MSIFSDSSELPESNTTFYGTMKISIVSSKVYAPIKDATVTISYTGDPSDTLYVYQTDESGQTPEFSLLAPDVRYSQNPDPIEQPYSEYNIFAEAGGYESAMVSGSEVLAGQLTLQTIYLTPSSSPKKDRIIAIPPHTLFGSYPPKIPEEEIKPLNETGEIVLSQVVIPEYIIVHDGSPGDEKAPNYWVRYRDYIKNVASSEIYPTWPESTIYANILAIQSFALNRVYTEWYRNRGYDFTITSTTAYDQKWIYGRSIYETIDYAVDNIFANYLSFPGIRQPVFTSYCDGERVTCNGLSQWGSKYLGDQGYSAIEILRRYYGSDMYINTAEAISGVPSSWPGYNLETGSTGEKVRQVQIQLNRIGKNYPAIPPLNADGIYGPATSEAVRIFQQIFNLPQTGIVDYATWYEISEIFVAVSRIAEP